MAHYSSLEENAHRLAVYYCVGSRLCLACPKRLVREDGKKWQQRVRIPQLFQYAPIFFYFTSRACSVRLDTFIPALKSFRGSLKYF